VRLTPLEIRKQTFTRKRLGGVDPEEVQDFLNLVASEVEEFGREHDLYRERLEAAQQKIDEFKTLEETLRRTLVRAERMSTESKENARREGDLILEQAKFRAERVLADARARLRQLTAELDDLQKKKEVFLHRFRALVGRQLELLDQHRPDYDELSRIADDAHDALDRYDQPVYAVEDDDRGPDVSPVPESAPATTRHHRGLIAPERPRTDDAAER